ncbi:unnamed protein product [Adineta ricciae]|uniref:Uncharacterized protein n=1 Tax=Adineta ricciae TaxID=249248 RepID=A0A815GE20_ADIRI|nr:unnamed protein product [Adineta ricciae]CAF1337202.1 unnamed protein product [Adineta ricciae]
MDNYVKIANEYQRKFFGNIPHRLIFANLICGLVSLLMSISGFYRFSSLFILLAGVCSYLNGKSYRQQHPKPETTNQFESFADMTSFAVAPVILVHSLKNWSFLLIVAFISFPFAGAYRIVKLNPKSTNDYVLGLPLPAAGIVVALLAFFSLVSPIIMIILSLLMSTSLEIPKP